MKDLSTTILTSLTDVKNIRDEIDNLIINSNNILVFNITEYLLIWCDIFLTEKDELFYITIRSGNELVSIAPLYIKDSVLRFLCTGEEEDDEVTSEYLDVIVKTGYESIVSESYATILNNNKWNEIRFDHYLSSSYISNYIINIIDSNNWKTKQSVSGIRYYLPLPTNQEKLTTQLKGSFYRGLKNKYRKLQSVGVTHELIINDLEKCSETFNSMRQLHNKRWQKEGMKGVFESSKFNEFHNKIFPHLINNNMLFLFKMTKGNQDISVVYGFIYKGEVSYYQSGYIIDEYDKYSLGAVTLYAAIKEAVEMGALKFDFMMGDENSYKKLFKCNEDKIYSLYASPPGIKHQLRLFLNFFKKIYKKITIRISHV